MEGIVDAEEDKNRTGEELGSGDQVAQLSAKFKRLEGASGAAAVCRWHGYSKDYNKKMTWHKTLSSVPKGLPTLLTGKREAREGALHSFFFFKFLLVQSTRII